MNILKRPLMFLAGAIIILMVVSCDKSGKYEREELERIDKYLSANPDLNYEKKPSGLYYLEINPGNGIALKTHDTAYIKYTGKFIDGSVFDTNIKTNGTVDTLITPVNEGFLIQGFDEGVTYMQKGGKSLMLIPSSLAYGPYGYAIIPGYATLLFEVELVRVVEGPGN